MTEENILTEVYIWILSGVLGFLLTFFIIIARIVARNVGDKFDVLAKAIQDLSNLTVQQTEQIKTLFMNKDETNKRLNNVDNKQDDHASRIRELEFVQIINKCAFKNGNNKKDHKGG